MKIAPTISLTMPKTSFIFLKIAAALLMAEAAASVVIGALSLSLNTIDIFPVPLLIIIGSTVLILYILANVAQKEAHWGIIVFALIAMASAVFIRALPEYYIGLSINGVIHRSFVSALLLLAFSIPAACFSLYYLFGKTPRADDIARYPLFVLPAMIGLAAYGIIIVHIVVGGAPKLNWSLLTHPFVYQSITTEVWRDGWPYFDTTQFTQVGMRNHILGTLLIIGLTSVISLPIGVGVGVFIHQYAGKKVAALINFSTTALRSISGIILIVAAINIIRSIPAGTVLSHIFRGSGYSMEGVLMEGRSSYLFISLFISLLVIPLIAKATEEGFNSLPQDISEGSLAVGASKEHTLMHILLPWSLPNIITGLVLGCAEAAGALTVIFLISGTGEFGVSPLSETTSLAYLIFDCRYGREMGDQVQTIMGEYQLTAALLLLVITVGLTIITLILKRKFSRRYKGA